MDEPTPVRGDDVLDPVDVASISESDQEAVPVRERVDGGPVGPSARTTPVEDDAEAGKPTGRRPERGVGDPAIHTSQPYWKWHRPSLRPTFQCLHAQGARPFPPMP